MKKIKGGSVKKTAKLNREDFVWVLSLFGTAIGAGVLFLPINAGLGGIIPLFVMLLLAFPMTFLAHRSLCRFVLSKKGDITSVGEQYFGQFGGIILTVLYFFAILPILLIYSVGITNTVDHFLTDQLRMQPMNRAFLSFLLVGILIFLVSFGEKIIVRIMSVLVFPFIVVLILIALWLIPQWHGAIFSNISFSLEDKNFWNTLWLIMPVMVFAFNHSPIISSLAIYCKNTYSDEDRDSKASKIIAYSNILMVFVVMFFVFSCVLCLSPEQLVEAKSQNVSILTYLANTFEKPFIFYVAPIVAFIAISKSFLGHYLGSREGFNQIVMQIARNVNVEIPTSVLNKVTALATFFICWFVAYKDPSILGIIESFGGPILAVILFILPIYAIYKFQTLSEYKRPIRDIFILLLGLVTISAAVRGLF